MADYTLKNIPEDLYRRLQAAAEEQFRSINQEVLARLSRSFDAQDAKVSALHARWVHEALASGPASPLKQEDVFEEAGAPFKKSPEPALPSHRH